MSQNFHEAYDNEHPDMPSERSTGFVFAGVSIIIGAIVYYSSGYTNLTALYIGAAIAIAFAALAQFAPNILRPLNIIWFKFSILLFKIMNPLIMLVMFVVLIVPSGLIMQLKRDPLRRKQDKNVKSYWIEKDPEQSTRTMKNQF